MIPLAVDELRGLGELDAAADEVTGVRVDSRLVSAGDLFVAVGGGEAFVEDARARGAAATLVPHDAFAALAVLAQKVRDRSDARVVGITGSYGKTTTKDILAAIAAPQRRTVAAERSFNNEIGVPLTVCRVEPDTEICILELSMRGFGQIAENQQPRGIDASGGFGNARLDRGQFGHAPVQAKAHFLTRHVRFRQVGLQRQVECYGRLRTEYRRGNRP